MERNRYNFKLNQTPPTDEQIARHMDFGALLEQHNAQKKSGGLIRTLKWIAPLAAAAAVAGWILFSDVLTSSDAKYQKAQNAYFAEQPYVNPPIPALQAQFVSQKIDAYEGGAFSYENGSRVIVPKAAFVNEQGEVIGGEIEIRYREYHDYVDFFLSGIPMHYDSSGTRYQLESAGMMELYAEQNGERLNVAPGKKIEIELKGDVMVSADNPDQLPNFNIYSLDIPNRNWKFEGIDNIEWADQLPQVRDAKETAELTFNKEKKNIESNRKAAIESLSIELNKPQSPRKPERTNPDDITFDLAFSEFDDPSLEGLKEKYAGSMWKVVDNKQEFNTNAAQGVQWEDMKLKKLNDIDFELTLFSGGNSIKVVVNPVLTGDELIQAQNNYSQALTAYQANLDTWQKAVDDKQSSLNRKYDALLLAAKNDFENSINDVADAKGKMLKRKVINRFTADRLGIWNCDFPTKPYDSEVKGNFVDDAKNNLEKNTGFLVDKNQNTISRFYTSNETPVSYNMQSSNLMWIVAEDGNIAVFQPENFDKINTTDGSYTFKMNRIDKDIKSEAELRRILEF